jgi:predicted transcriptional regulator
VTSQDCRSMRRKIRETRLDLARYARVDRVRLNLFENGHIALRDEEITRLVKALRRLAQKRAAILSSLLPKTADEQQAAAVAIL